MRRMRTVLAWATTLALVPLVAVAAGGEATDLDSRVAALEAQVATLNQLHGITTTTTVPAPPTTVGGPSTTTSLPPSPEFGAVSVVGCSNVFDAVAGYLEVSAKDVLKNTAYGGFYLQKWAFKKWPDSYVALRPAAGYDASWVILCERFPNELSVEITQLVIDRIWATDPGIPVFISPLHEYPNELCSVTGGNSIPIAGKAVADLMAAADPLVFRGPDLGPLGTEHLRGDHCHLTDDGAAFLGVQIAAFFDAD